MTTQPECHEGGRRKVALITGASRGLGLALARRLSQLGWNLIIDGRDAAALRSAHEGLPTPAHVIAIPGDITDLQHRKDLAVEAQGAGGLDLLINNAGALGPSPQPALLDYPITTLEWVFRTNVFAPLALIQTLNGAFKPRACIINVTSDAAVVPYAGWGGYGAGKAALEQLSAVLAGENPDLHIYWVDPGDMRTRMHQEAFPAEDISDRPLPEESVPGFELLIMGDFPSGRYRVGELLQGWGEQP